MVNVDFVFCRSNINNKLAYDVTVCLRKTLWWYIENNGDCIAFAAVIVLCPLMTALQTPVLQLVSIMCIGTFCREVFETGKDCVF